MIYCHNGDALHQRFNQINKRAENRISQTEFGKKPMRKKMVYQHIRNDKNNRLADRQSDKWTDGRTEESSKRALF